MSPIYRMKRYRQVLENGTVLVHHILKRLQTVLKSTRSTTGPLAEENFEGTLSDVHNCLMTRPDSPAKSCT